MFYFFFLQALENCPQELENSPQAEPQVVSDNCSSDYDESFLDDFSDTDSCHENQVAKIVFHLPFISWLANFFGAIVWICLDQGKTSLEVVHMHAHAVVCVCSWNKKDPSFVGERTNAHEDEESARPLLLRRVNLHHILVIGALLHGDWILCFHLVLFIWHVHNKR